MRLIYLLTCLFLSVSCFAQQDKNAVVLTAGPAFPVGAYGRNDLQNPEAGFAKTGPQVQISFLHGRNRFGWVLAVTAQRNGLDSRSMEQELAEKDFQHGVYASTTGAPMPGPYPSRRYGNWKVKNSFWFLGTVQAGGFILLPASGNLSFTVKAMAGIAYARSPVLAGESITDTAQAWVTQSRGTGFGLAYSLAGGLQYRLNQHIALTGGLTYHATGRIRFDDISATFTAAHFTSGMPSQWESQMVTGYIFQRLASLNLHAGLSFPF